MGKLSREIFKYVTLSAAITMALGACSPPTPETEQPVTAAVSSSELTPMPQDLKDLPVRVGDKVDKFAIKKDDEEKLKDQKVTIVKLDTPIPLSQVKQSEVAAGAILLYEASQAGIITLGGYAVIIAKPAIDLATVPGYLKTMIEGPYQVPIFNADGKLIAYRMVDTYGQTSFQIDQIVQVDAKNVGQVAQAVAKAAGGVNFNDPGQGSGQIQPTPQLPDDKPRDDKDKEISQAGLERVSTSLQAWKDALKVKDPRVRAAAETEFLDSLYSLPPNNRSLIIRIKLDKNLDSYALNQRLLQTRLGLSPVDEEGLVYEIPILTPRIPQTGMNNYIEQGSPARGRFSSIGALETIRPVISIEDPITGDATALEIIPTNFSIYPVRPNDTTRLGVYRVFPREIENIRLAESLPTYLKQVERDFVESFYTRLAEAFGKVTP